MPAAPQPFAPTPLSSGTALAAAVRRARSAQGLSIRDLAERARVGKRFVLEVEQGKTTVRLDKMLALLAALRLRAIILPG